MDFSSSWLPSNFSYVGGCQDFMAIWLSYPSRWLALIYAEINLQNLICLTAPEALGVRPKTILIYSLPRGPRCDVTTCFLFNLAWNSAFLSLDTYIQANWVVWYKKPKLILWLLIHMLVSSYSVAFYWEKLSCDLWPNDKFWTPFLHF